MSVATKLDHLAQVKIPAIAEKKFPDRMDILEESTTTGPGGGKIKGDPVEAYVDVPCLLEMMQTESRINSADRLVSVQLYKVTFPTHQGGFRIDLDLKKSQFRVLERGNEPEKILEIEAGGDQMGVLYEVICTKEN